MEFLEPKETCEIVIESEEHEAKPFLDSDANGIFVYPDKKDQENETPLVPSDAGDFVKWIRIKQPTVAVDYPRNDRLLVRRSGDVWLPLVALAQDIALPIYLNIVASYMYDKMKGSLKGDVQRIHVSALYRDKKKGITKKFNFEGSAEALKALAQKTDFDDLFHE